MNEDTSNQFMKVLFFLVLAVVLLLTSVSSVAMLPTVAEAETTIYAAGTPKPLSENDPLYSEGYRYQVHMSIGEQAHSWSHVMGKKSKDCYYKSKTVAMKSRQCFEETHEIQYADYQTDWMWM